MKPRIAVISFPGSNCERESLLALKRNGFDAVEFLWKDSLEHLRGFDGFFIVGGFSYEDRSRSGIISAQDPILQVLQEENLKGKGLLGVCNGAQILVESGIVPGWEGPERGVALGPNLRIKDGHLVGTGFYNAWIEIASPHQSGTSLFNYKLEKGETLRIPAAHAEGRFILGKGAEELLLANQQNAFVYTDKAGQMARSFPENPNASALSLAGITNPAGTALALMPHPERTRAGDPLFASWRAAFSDGWSKAVNPISWSPTQEAKPTGSENQPAPWVWHVGSVLTDNTALSVENALKTKGLPLKVSRHIVWKVTPPGTSEISEKEVRAKADFFNSSKEFLIDESLAQKEELLLTVWPRAGMDPEGREKEELLCEVYPDIPGDWSVRRGVSWRVTPDGTSPHLPENWKEMVQQTHLLSHPLLHEVEEGETLPEPIIIQ